MNHFNFNKYFICLPQLVIGSILYCFHRFALFIPSYKISFFRGFFPDFLALIVCIPIFASSQKIFRLRRKNKIYFFEMLGYVLLFSLYFEIIGPKYIKTFTGDIWDIIAYFLGGLTLYLSNYYYLKSKKDQNTSTYQ